MNDVALVTLPVPRPCGLCGRPTTQYRRDLAVAFCGREEPPADWATPDDFPPVRGGHRARDAGRRRLLRRGTAPRTCPSQRT